MGNFWSKFLGLLPPSKKIVGTITSVSSGVYTIQLVDGGFIQATSVQSIAIATKVFVKDGVIIGTAPALPSLEIEV